MAPAAARFAATRRSVNIASVGGLMGTPKFGACRSQAPRNRVYRALALEAGHFGITCNTLGPPDPCPKDRGHLSRQR